MEKIRITIDLNCASGEYEMTFKNVSSPGEYIDYGLVRKMLCGAFKQLDNDIESSGNDSTDNFIKEIH